MLRCYLLGDALLNDESALQAALEAGAPDAGGIRANSAGATYTTSISIVASGAPGGLEAAFGLAASDALGAPVQSSYTAVLNAPASPATQLSSVTLTMTASGSVSDYQNTASLRAAIATLAGVDASAVSVIVSAASVLITATIAVPASASAAAMLASLSKALPTAAAASSLLGISAESVPTLIVATSTIVIAASPPSTVSPSVSPSPSLASPPPSPSQSDDGNGDSDTDSANTKTIVISLTVIALLALVVAAVVAGLRQRNSKKMQVGIREKPVADDVRARVKSPEETLMLRS